MKLMILTRMIKKKKLALSSTVLDGAGFTLIELIVVIAILGILAGIGLTSFRTSQIKSRDAKRKSDLEQVQRAVEMYMNDAGHYPNSAAIGGTIGDFSWGVEFKDAKGTVYMKELPKNPTGNPEYCYKAVVAPTPATSYQLYAKLENTQDPACLGGNCATARACGAGTYNYGVASSNATP